MNCAVAGPGADAGMSDALEQYILSTEIKNRTWARPKYFWAMFLKRVDFNQSVKFISTEGSLDTQPLNLGCAQGLTINSYYLYMIRWLSRPRAVDPSCTQSVQFFQSSLH